MLDISFDWPISGRWPYAEQQLWQPPTPTFSCRRLLTGWKLNTLLLLMLIEFSPRSSFLLSLSPGHPQPIAFPAAAKEKSGVGAHQWGPVGPTNPSRRAAPGTTARTLGRTRANVNDIEIAKSSS
jgi:hypothetical protein